MKKQLLALAFCGILGQLHAQADLALNTHQQTGFGTEYGQHQEPVLLDSDIAELELVSFEAASSGNEGVMVRFATVSEREYEHFIIQRSQNLLDWHTVTAFPGQGATDAYTAYEVLDHAPIAGVSYYRLVQDGDDGLEELSDLFSVRHESAQDLSFQGGYKPGHFTLHANGNITEVSVLNNRGQFMPMQLELDGERVSVNAELLENGTYYVQAIVDGNPVMRPIIISNGSVSGG